MADVASLTACVVVDCCSKTRDSNTPPYLAPPRRARLARLGCLESVRVLCTSGVFPPFQGWPASLVAPGPALSDHGGQQGPGHHRHGHQGTPGASHQPQTLYYNCDSVTRAPGSKVQTREWNYLSSMIVIQSSLKR